MADHRRNTAVRRDMLKPSSEKLDRRQRVDIGRISRRRFIEGTALALGGNLTHSFDGLFGAGAALAQGTGESTWPSRPVRFIVPLAAGGGLDFVARVISEHMSRELRQQIFIENRTGAGGTIGIDTAIKSTPDGYSVLISNDNVAAAPHVLQLNVDFLKDLLPVALIGRQPQALAVHPSLAAVKSCRRPDRTSEAEAWHGLRNLRRRLHQHVLRNGSPSGLVSSSTTCPIAAQDRRSTI